MNRWYYCYDSYNIRVWTDEQAQYGKFDVMSHEQYNTFKKLCEEMNWSFTESYD